MSPESGLLASIAAAEGHVRDARESWDATSISGCAVCSGHLQHAVDEMQAACEAAAQGPAPTGAKDRLDRLRRDVEVLSRLVDAAIAFSRGLALRSDSQFPSPGITSTEIGEIAHA